MKHWLFRHLFLILAIILSEILVLVFFITRPYQRVESQVLTSQVADQPILDVPRPQAQPCPVIPFYDPAGQALDPTQPYQGSAPVYRIDLPDCNYPTSLPPEQVTGTGTPYYALHMKSSPLNEWIKSGESFQMWVEFALEESFLGQQSLESEAIAWQPGETQEVHIWLDAPNFDVSPANPEVPAQRLIIGGRVRQNWVLAPKERASGRQVISITLLELHTAPGRVDLTTQIALQILPILNIGPLTLVLVPLALITGWALDHLKTALEIQAMLLSRRRGKKTPGVTAELVPIEPDLEKTQELDLAHLPPPPEQTIKQTGEQEKTHVTNHRL